MKTITKLTWIFLIAAFLIPGLKAQAQCSVSYTYSANPANNGEVTFTASANGATSASYYWDFGDGGFSSGQTTTYTYASSGSYTVYLEMQDTISSCLDSVIFVITVTNNNSSPSCSAAFLYDSTSSGHFLNHSTGSGLTSTWSFGDGSSGTSNGDITHVYPSSGMYYVCLSVSNFLGTCSDTYCDSVLINTGTSGMCQGSVNSYFSSTDSGSYVVFYNTPTGTGPVYFWDFGDGTSSSDVGSTTHIYSAPGTYLTCLTVYETGGTYDSCQYCHSVTFGGTPACDASFIITQDSTNTLSYYIYNNTINTSPTATFLWNFGDGTSSNQQYPVHTYPGSGPYYICLTVADSNPAISCSNTYCDSLAAGRGVSSPITLTVVQPMTTGIAETSTITTLKNYPNPFNGSTVISYSISKDAAVELSITDLLGNRIASLENSRKTSGNYSVDWNAENIAGGMYLLQIKVNNEISTRKIILTK